MIDRCQRSPAGWSCRLGFSYLPTNLRRRKTDQCVGQAPPGHSESLVLRGEVISVNCRYYSLSTLALACPPSRGRLASREHQEILPTMLTRLQQIENIRDLREYVNTTLCSHCQLKAGAFSMTERVLMRAGKPCGIYFCLHGPRATKFTAIWETDRNQVLFYGSRGERFLKTQLLVAPRFESAAA